MRSIASDIAGSKKGKREKGKKGKREKGKKGKKVKAQADDFP